MEHIIQRVLLNYNIIGYNAIKNGKCYIIDCGEDKFILNSHRRNKKGIKELFQFKEDIYNNGFRKTSRVVKSNNGNSYIITKDRIYYLTTYIENENKMELSLFYKSTMQVLRNFHKCTKELHPEKYRLRREYGKTIDKYIRRLVFLVNLKQELNMKIIKAPLDSKVYDILNAYDNIFDKCLLILRSVVPKSSEKLLRYKFCISNLGLDNFGEVEGKILLRDIPKIKQSYYLTDLGSLLNSIENSSSIKWNYSFFEELVNTYNKEETFIDEEIYLLYCFTIFPYRLYEICKGIYKKQNTSNINILRNEFDYLIEVKENLDLWIKKFEEKYNM
ncbi:hypothetical protein [Clostridium paridis]|uniref:Spore coat protein n=1 Tax=Clostridium paridis TaxID=2803863 RepID=A0A937FDP1_9CLOT|nr:hypothetical protein [Clostridium paridis]MBL4930925.1 hypothetical protein [Clostridium paridis]